MKWLCCISKTTVEDSNENVESKCEEVNQVVEQSKSADFIPTSDSILVPTRLDTIQSSETLSDSDSVVATVGDSYSNVKEIMEPVAPPPSPSLLPLPSPIAPAPIQNKHQKKNIKSPSRYVLGKVVSYFYLSVNRYYFIKNKNDAKNVSFGKFLSIDSSMKNYAIFEIYGMEQTEKFDTFEYFFYRAVPKK